MVNLGFDYNYTPQSDGSFSPEQIHQLIFDLRDEPRWRENAELEANYYDGNQLTQETLQRMAENGIPPTIVNMIQPAIDGMRGFEAIIRTDPMVVPENEESYEGVEALNEKFKEALRLTKFNAATAGAYFDQVKIGIGWFEVTRQSDPYKYPYRALRTPWREMFWDWRAREPDLSDSRYIMRRRWYDYDFLMAAMPQHKELIRNAAHGWPNDWIETWERYSSSARSETLARSLAGSRQYEENASLEEREWRDMTRGRVALYEIQYRVPKRAQVLRFPDGRVIELQRKNPLHLEVLERGLAQLVEGPSNSLRQAFYIGPHKLYDKELPYKDYHYFPAIANREDGDGSVYGKIRTMKSSQENINARHSRLLYDTSSRKTLIDEDAVDNHAATAKELGRVDGYIKLKSDRANAEALKVLSNTETSNVTMELLHEAKRNIFDASGLSPEFGGAASSAQLSGVALDTIINQGKQNLAPILDNYKGSREKGARRLLELMVMDMQMQDNIEVSLSRTPTRAAKKIFLNARSAGDMPRTNNIVMLRKRVVLSDVPATATYQQQKFMALTEITKSMPPELQAALLDLIVMAADVPERDMILERIRAVTGFGPEPEDPQEREKLQQQQQEQEQLEKQKEVIELLEREGQARLVMAEAALTEAKAEKLRGADTDHTEAKTAQEYAKLALAAEDSDRKDIDQQRDLLETGASLVLASEQAQAKLATDAEPKGLIAVKPKTGNE